MNSLPPTTDGSPALGRSARRAKGDPARTAGPSADEGPWGLVGTARSAHGDVASPPPIWDIALAKTLGSGVARFELDVRFSSGAARLVLFGPSGAGKTQTLKMIAGVVRPDRARVVVAGRMLFDPASQVDLTPQQRRLAYVFQDYALFPHLTVRQNIAFARRAGWLNPSTDAIDAAVERWIDAFHLQTVVGHYPHQLSGGQRQRTALARGLVNEPTALLLDEPFAALDKGLRQRLRDELRDLQAQLQLPMLLITHDDDDIHALADDVVHLQAGRVVAEAAP